MLSFSHYLTLPYLWTGASVALGLMVMALAGGVLGGFFIAQASLSTRLWLKLPARLYVYVLRGTPLLLILIFFFDVLPQAGLDLSPFWSALLALLINETAFCSEIIRGGIQSVDADQRLAAEASGFSATAEMTRIVVPQALLAIMPALGNEAIGLLKSTSLASVVGVNELTMRGQTIVAENFMFVPVFVASGAIYVAMSSLVALAQWWIERHMDVRGRARSTPLAPAAGIAAPAASAARPRHRITSHPLLVVAGVEIRYDARVILRGVSLHVRRGEVVVLLGPSGSGKSTLLRAILALVPMASGAITVDGERIGAASDGRPLPRARLPKNRAAAGIAMVFQNFALFRHMSVTANAMSIPLHVQHVGRIEARRRAARALDRVGMAAFAGAYPHQLSGGQMQRVAIARALAADPRIVLFDEPTSALDPQLVREAAETIRRLAAEGTTMLITTHDLHFAARVADRVVFLQDGRIVEEGTRDILASPRTPEFAAFLRHADTALEPDVMSSGAYAVQS